MIVRRFNCQSKGTANTSHTEVILSISSPYFVEELGYWQCDFNLKFPNSFEDRYAVGEDALQSFLLALNLIKAFIQRYEKKEGVIISWLDMPNYGLL